MIRGMQTSWKQGNLLPVHFKHLSRVHLLCEKNGRRDLVAIKFKDNAADIVKTVDRAGLMTNRFKDISLRTKDDLEDMFGQREGSYDYASDATMHGMADGTDIAMRAGAEMIHKAGFEKLTFPTLEMLKVMKIFITLCKSMARTSLGRSVKRRL